MNIARNSNYDADLLVLQAKRSLRISIIKISVAAVAFILSILAIIFLGSYMPVFVGGIVLAGVCAFILCRWIKRVAYADYSSACGEIVEVHKEVKIVDTKFVGSIGLGPRKYDTYNKTEVRLAVYIKNGQKVCGYCFRDGTEEHARYYEAKGEAMHIWGTRFPIRLGADGDRWLCPVCGEFNPNDEKTCTRCKRKIIK